MVSSALSLSNRDCANLVNVSFQSGNLLPSGAAAVIALINCCPTAAASPTIPTSTG